MAKYRIDKLGKGKFIIKERFLFFFWATLTELGSELDVVPLEFDHLENAREHIKKLKMIEEFSDKTEKIIEYH